LSSDIALQGRDRLIGFAWKSYNAKVAFNIPKADGKDVETILCKAMAENFVPRSKCVVDADGLGSYLDGYLTIDMYNLYFAVFFPLAIGKEDDFVLQLSDISVAKIAAQNPHYDLDKDSKITRGEVVKYLDSKP